VQDFGNINRPYSKKHLWPCDAGFFFEISKGAICAGNIFVNCDHGIWVLNSSNVYITRNTLINSTVCIGRTDRVAEGDVFGWHADTGPRVDERDGHIFINNLHTANETFRRPLLNIWQPADLCKRLSKPIVKQLDYNIYVNSSDIPLDPLIMWSPVKNDDCQLLFKSIKDLQKLHSKFSGHSQYYAEYFGPLFKSRELGNYQLLKSFPGSTKAARLPDTILEILGKSKKDIQYAGAYPPVE
jgi:parallel beta-helix repeat protein